MKNIFREGNCLNEEQIINYLQGNLIEREKHEIEHHLLECELCSDAIEGYQLLKNPENIKEINTELDYRYQTLVKNTNESTVQVLFPWRIAAAFALIFLSGLTLWLILPKQDNVKLFTQEYKPYPAPEIQSATQIENSQPTNKIAEPEKATKISNNEQVKAKTQNENISTKTLETESVDQADLSVIQNDDNKDEIAQRETNEKITTGAVVTQQSPVPDIKGDNTTTGFSMKDQPSIKEETTLSAVSIEKTTSIKKQVKTPASLFSNDERYQAGIEAYNKGNYSEAVNLLDKVNTTPDALFYSGVAYLSLENPHLAIKRLQKFRTKGENKLTEASFWYEALAQLKAENKKSARICLNEVIKLNGDFKERAEQLIKKL